jgi:hypothetical protein
MSNASVLIQKIQKRREFKVELEDGKSVTMRRPAEAEWARAIGLDYVCRYSHAWEGFTEADLYAGGGSDVVVPFDAALWREVVADRADWLTKCADGLIAAMSQRAEERKATAGN